MEIFATNNATFALFSALVLLAGCGGDGVSPGPGGEPTYARDIQPLVAAKCSNCHVEGGIAPFALGTYEQVSERKGAIAAAVSARVMPPWQAAAGCTDYRGDESLTPEQIDLVSRWVDAGAPQGDPSETPVPVVDSRLSLSRVDLELPIPVPYTPQTFPDDYRCFLVDWPAAETTYVTGFGAEPDNQAIVHHLITFIARPASVPTYQALDDADPGPGWACYGGPGGDGNGPRVSWLGGWAPGGAGQDLPEGTGVEIPVGSKLVVQMHYNSQTAKPAPDQTKILVRTDTSVKKKAAVMPFADPKWLAGGMPIPAHSKDVMHSVALDPTELVSIVTGGVFAGGKPLTVYAAGPHMHTLGRRITSRIDHIDGTQECMMDIPRWNFHWQLQYNFAKPKQVAPGDKLYLECQWDNPGDTDVNWGEGTSDEMCLGVYYVTE